MSIKSLADGVAGGLPTAIRDQYKPTAHALFIPVVEYAGQVYTNVTVTVGTVL